MCIRDSSKGVSKLICVVKVKAGDDGKMFGSVTAGMIADELKHQFDITLDKDVYKRQIQSNALRLTV